MKTCPYCQEQIPDDAKKCPECGERLRTPIKINKEIIKRIGIACIIILLLAGVVYTGYNEIIGYKNIVPLHENIDPYNSTLTGKDALFKLSVQEKNLQKYLKGIHLQANKDKVFVNFVKNMSHYINIFNAKTSIEYSDFKIFNETGEANVNGVEILIPVKMTYIDGYAVPEFTENGRVKYPYTPVIIVSAGEGMFEGTPSYMALKNDYSKYLSKQMKNYISIKAKESKYPVYQKSYDLPYLTTSIKDWQEFIQKYPNSLMKDEAINNIHKNTAKFINHWDMFRFENKLRPEAKKEYELFLKNIKSDTDAYKEVNKAYEILKAHSFNRSKELESYQLEISNKYKPYE